MKNFFSLFALIALLVLTPIEAQAKRFGGKSFGNKSYKTAPVKNNQKRNDSPNYQSNKAKKTSNKRGMLGGMLGGLLVGGLLASLFNGSFDGFEGLQFMDMLIMAGIAFALFKLFKSMRANSYASQPRFASTGYAPQQNYTSQANQGSPVSPSGSQSSNSLAHDVPMNFPVGFDQYQFANGARDHFRQLQAAWNIKDEAKIKEYLAPSLHNDIMQDIHASDNSGQIEVIFVDAQIVRAEYTSELQSVSLHFTGECIDRSHQGKEEVNDIWHLERSLTQPQAPWLIVGINS